MVRLKAVGNVVKPTLVSTFQFQNGAIKSLNTVSLSTQLGMFQFQNGAIKRGKGDFVSVHEVTRFNSKMVRLKVSGARAFTIKRTRFNSKMVRLKVDATVWILAFATQFQFQNGAIKSGHIFKSVSIKV